jgi:hypothetical protein
MPNWCNNNISISGPTDTIKQLWEDANQEDGGLLSAMAPQPENMFHGNLGTKEREECAEQGIPNWYDWNVENWGTKWDVSTEGLEFTDNGDGTAMIEGWFDSAWAPPIGAYEKFCDDMDNCHLEASYFEGGMDFGGFWSSEDGDEYIENCQEEASLPEDEQSGLFRRLDEEYGLSEQYAEWDEENLVEEG